MAQDAVASLPQPDGFSSDVQRRRFTALRRSTVCALLLTQVVLLGHTATQNSPTHLEPAFLASGVSHWQLGRFELYRVNPPLVRMVAALPALLLGCKTDWSRYYDGPGSRAEFTTGNAFITANGPDVLRLFFYGRWACIPFSAVGAYFAYRWARELYRCNSAGFIVLVTYIFDPNLLAHGSLMTPDAPCTAIGIVAGYLFWQWLKSPGWTSATFAGLALGIATLTKFTWLILFGLWPVLWLTWQLSVWTPRRLRVDGNTSSTQTPPISSRIRSLVQIAAMFLIAIGVINAGYGCIGFGRHLKQFQFVSTTLTGLKLPGKPGNRFRGHTLGELPVPLPEQFLLGIDSQKKDLEDFGQPSYLRGTWNDGGWWYYYIYGFLVKTPVGTLGLFVVAVLVRFSRHRCPVALRDELVLLVPAIALLAAVSAHTEFNIHWRYSLPAFGLFSIFLGNAGFCLTRLREIRTFVLVAALSIAAAGESIFSGPSYLSFFNAAAGGAKNGHFHLLGSSVDWGQELLALEQWRSASKVDTCFVVSAYRLDPMELGLNLKMLPLRQEAEQLAPGIYAVSVNVLHSPRYRSHPVVARVIGQEPYARMNAYFIYCIRD